MDDVMYLPLRRTLVKPMYSYYKANYGSSPVDRAIKFSINDIIHEISNEGKGLFYELRPRDVTHQRNTFIFDSKFQT